MRAFGEAGVDEIDIVGHSMGGLVARDALTRPGVDRSLWAPVGTLVMVGTPHLGSALAPLRGVAEARDRAQRYVLGDATLEETLDFASDGSGEAGRDLAMGSAYLEDLNARPRPESVRLVCVVGRWAPAWADGAASAALGDGVVSVESATLESADEIIEVRGNHRGMLLSTPLAGETTAVRAVVDALAGGD
jgi:pimeloyl-ACP methyl ester carboxylesterase